MPSYRRTKANHVVLSVLSLGLLAGCSPELMGALQNLNNLPRPGASGLPAKPGVDQTGKPDESQGAFAQPGTGPDKTDPKTLLPGETLVLQDESGSPLGKGGKAIPALEVEGPLVIDPLELPALPATGKDAPEPAAKLAPSFLPAKLSAELPLLPEILVETDKLPLVQAVLLKPLVQDVAKLSKDSSAKPVVPSSDRQRGGGGTTVTISGSGFGTAGTVAMDGLLGEAAATILEWTDGQVRLLVPDEARPGANRLSMRYGNGLTFDLPFEMTSAQVPVILIRSLVNQQMRTLSVQIHNHTAIRRSGRPFYEQPGRSFIAFQGQEQLLAIPPVVRDLGGAGTLEAYVNSLHSNGATAELQGNRFRLNLTFADQGVELITYNTGTYVPRWFENSAMPDIDLRHTSLATDLQLVLQGGQIGYTVANVTLNSEMVTTGVLPDVLIRALFNYRAEIKQQVESNLRNQLAQGVMRQRLISGLNDELRRTLRIPADVSLTQLTIDDRFARIGWN